MTSSKFHPTFTSPLDPAEAPAPVRLSHGAELPGLICIPSILAMSGPHHFVDFAKGFTDARDVSVLPLPGFAGKEHVPATFNDAIEAQAEALVRCTAEPFVLVGYSAGGVLAHAIASQLERIGIPPAAVILIDTYPLDSNRIAELMKIMLTQRAMSRYMTDTRLSAMGAYMRLLLECKPTEIAAPTLLIRASEPMAGLSADRQWQSSWPFSPALIDVPGDHSTMMEEHAGSTARAAADWLAGIKAS